MIVHIDVPDPVDARRRCPDCNAALPLRMLQVDQSWYVGQICLRCRKRGMVIGVFDTPLHAHQELVLFLIDALQRDHARPPLRPFLGSHHTT